MAPSSDDALRAHLDAFLGTVDRSALAANDPVSLVRPYADPADREVAGFVVAMLAYGRVASIRAKAAEALELLGPHPAQALARGRRWRRLDGFVYRFQRGDDLVRFLTAVRRVRRRHGTLAAALARHAHDDDPDFVPAMSGFIEELSDAVDGEFSYGLRFLLPHPARGAAKRLCLYLRWMVREDDGADLGAWQRLEPKRLSPRRLIMPVDTHVARLGRYLGLTDRATQDSVMAREITASLRRLRPDDPLVYDLALCHLGISGRCPRQRDLACCRDCPIRAVCRLGPEPAGWSKPR